MKFHVFYIVFLFLSCSNFKKPKEIECILVESPTSLVSCGIWSGCLGMKFQKIGNKSLFVGIIHCPRSWGNDFFKAGNKYTILISKEKINKVCEVTFNEYENQKLTTYLVEDVYINDLSQTRLQFIQK